VLEHLGVLHRLEPLDVEDLDGGSRDRPEPEVDQRGRERPLVLVGHRPHGGEDREADEQQADRERVGEREAGVRREQDHSLGGGTSGPSGSAGMGSSGSGGSGPSGVSGTTGPGSGTAGCTGASGTAGVVGISGLVGTSSTAASQIRLMTTSR
jgi:hypothetical protein